MHSMYLSNFGSDPLPSYLPVTSSVATPNGLTGHDEDVLDYKYQGPVSRLGSFEPGDKTGLRLSPHLAPSTSTSLVLD